MGEIFKLFGTIGLNNDEANQGIDETTGRAQKSSSKIAGFFKKAALVIGGVFAAGKIINFGKMAVEAAASSQAIAAQFEQVFGDSQGVAQKAIDGMAKEFGMLPNRIKPSFTSTVSMFKGLGLSTEKAMEQATTAVTMASDAAAFYDMSYENANSALNSFIKGNYEGGESIGLFANETQMAAWAAEELGVDWKNLGEAEKQIARLEFAKAMQESAGATGQASRESESYENQLGNMKQAWQDFLAIVGQPILGIAVAGLQKVSEWLQLAGEKVQDFQAWFGELKKEVQDSTAWNTLKEVMQPIIDAFQSMRDTMSNSTFLDDIKQALSDMKDAMLDIDFVKLSSDMQAFIEKWTPLIAGITASATAYGIYTVALGIKSAAETIAIASMYAMEAATLALQGALAFLTSPITWVIVAIGLLVAAGVWLWKNWDEVSAKAVEIWGYIADFFSETWQAIKQGTEDAWNATKDFLAETWAAITEGAQTAWNAVATFFTDLWSSITTFAVDSWNSFTEWITGVWQATVDVATDIWQGLVNVFTFVWLLIKEVFNVAWLAISTPLILAWQAIVIAALAIWQPLVAFFTMFWENIKAVFLNIWTNLTTALNNIWTSIVNMAMAIYEPIKQYFTDLWNSIVNAAISVWTGITTTLTNVWLSLVNMMRAIFIPMAAFINSVWQSIKTAISTAVTTVVNFVVSWFNRLKNQAIMIFNAVKTGVATAVIAMRTTISNIISQIVTFVVSKFNALKTGVISIFNTIRTAAISAWNTIKSGIQTAVNAIRTTVTNIFNSIKNTISSVWNSVKSIISSAINSVKSTVSNGFNTVKSNVTTAWNNIKNAIMRPINAAKDAVKSAIDKMKGFMNFKWSLPKLKLPKVSIKGKFSLAPPSVPSFGIDWHAAGGIFNKATLFDTASGMHGVGEAGPEAIIPLNRETLGGIGEGIASSMGWSNERIADKLDAIVELLVNFFAGYDPNMQVVMDTGALVGAIKNEINRQLGNDVDLRGRGR